MNYIAIPGLKRTFLGRRPIFVADSPGEQATRIMEVVSKHYDISIGTMISKSRIRKYVVARQVCCVLIYKTTTMCLADIGKLLGGRDHTTAIHARKTIEDLLDTNEAFREEFDAIRNKL